MTGCWSQPNSSTQKAISTSGPGNLNATLQIFLKIKIKWLIPWPMNFGLSYRQNSLSGSSAWTIRLYSLQSARSIQWLTNCIRTARVPLMSHPVIYESSYPQSVKSGIKKTIYTGEKLKSLRKIVINTDNIESFKPLNCYLPPPLFTEICLCKTIMIWQFSFGVKPIMENMVVLFYLNQNNPLRKEGVFFIAVLWTKNLKSWKE